MAIFFLTTTGTSTIGAALPASFPGFADKIEAIGSGGNGVAATTARGGAGGAGGSYASATSTDGTLTLTSSTSYTIGAAGSATNTTITAGSVVITAPPGANGSTTTGGAAGAAGTPHGFSGGAGGNATATANTPGGGGGGAGGPLGAGANGGSAAGTASFGGSGGGGDGNSASATAGGTATSTTGGSAGSPNGGAGGAGRTTSGTATAGSRSASALNWDASHGVSGGGGGGGSNSVGSGTRVGGAGGAGNPASGFGYGGGGGGGGSAGATGGGLGAGSAGIIAITYTPVPILASATQAAAASVKPPFTGIRARQPTRFAGVGAVVALATIPGKLGQPYQGSAIYSGLARIVGKSIIRASATSRISGIGTMSGMAIATGSARAIISASASLVARAAAARPGAAAFSAVASITVKSFVGTRALAAPFSGTGAVRATVVLRNASRGSFSATASLVSTAIVPPRGGRYAGSAAFAGGSVGSISEVWSATHIGADISGGGTNVVTLNATNTFEAAFGSVGRTSGKYYWESSLPSLADGSGNTAIGIANTTSLVDWLGNSTDSIGLYFNAGFSSTNCVTVSVGGNLLLGLVAPSATDRMAVALDLDRSLIWFRNVTKATSWYGAAAAGDPVTGTNGFSLSQTGSTVLASPVVAAISFYNNGDTGTGYFDTASWIGAAPAGFLSLTRPVGGAGIVAHPVIRQVARPNFSSSAVFSGSGTSHTPRQFALATFSAASTSFIPELWSASHKDANISGGENTALTKTITSDNAVAYGSRGHSAGKYYWEISLSDANDGVGIGNTLSSVSDGTFLGSDFSSLGMYWNGPSTGFTGFLVNGAWYAESVNVGWNSGDRIAIALDLDHNWVWVKNVTQNSFWWGSDGVNPGDPVAGVNGFNIAQAGFTITANPVVPGASLYYAGNTSTGYFAQASWSGTAPAGFGSLDIPVAGAGISVKASAGRPAKTAFSGSGSLSGAARPRRSGKLPFSAIGSVQAIAVASRFARGMLSSAAVLTSTITANRVGRAVVSGNARFVGRATVLPPVRVSVSGTASLRATTARVVRDAPAISGRGSLLARAIIIARPLSSFSASGMLYGRARYRSSVSIGISAAATFLANANAIRRAQQFAAARFSGTANIQLYPTGIDARVPTNYAGAGSLAGRFNVARRISTSISGVGSLVVQSQIAFPTAQQYSGSATFSGAAKALFYDPLLYVVIDPPQPIIPSTTPRGTIVANLTGVRTDGKAFAGNFIFAATNWDDPPPGVNGPGAGVYAITQPGGFGTQGELIINPGGPGVGAAGGSIEHVTLIATDPPIPQVAVVAGSATFSARVLPYAFTRVRISAVATVTAPAVLRAGVAASWSAAALVSARTLRAMFGFVAVSGAANIVGHAAILPRSVRAVFSSVGSLAVISSVGVPVRAAISASGAFVGRAASQRPSSGSFAAAGTAGSAARIRLRARTSITGTASFYADSTPRFRQAQQYPGSASLAGTGQFSAQGARQQKIFSASAVFSGTAGSFYYDPLLYVVVSPTSWGSASSGATVALLTGIRTDGHPFHGNFTFAAPKWDDTGSHIVGSGAGVYAIVQPGGPGAQGSLIVNPNGPGLPSGGSVADMTIVVTDPAQPQVGAIVGSAAFTAASRRATAGRSTISGAGAFSATATGLQVVASRFAAVASLTAISLRRQPGKAAVSGAAWLAAAAVVAPKSVSGSVAASGLISGRAAIRLPARAMISGTGSVAVVAVKVTSSSTLFSAAASAVGIARVRVPGRTVITGTASFSAAAVRQPHVSYPYPGSAQFTGTAQFAAGAILQPHKAYFISASFSGGGSAVFADPLLYLVVNPPNPSIPTNTPLGATVALLTGVRTDGHAFTGNFTFAPPNWDDPPAHVGGPGAGVYAITQSSPGTQGALIINPNGPGVGAAGGSIEHVTLVANDPPVSQVAGITGAASLSARALRISPTRAIMSASGTLTVRAVPQRFTSARIAGTATFLANSDRFIKGAHFASAVILATAALGAAVRVGSRPRVQLSGNATLVGVTVRLPKGGHFASGRLAAAASLQLFSTGIRARQPTQFVGTGALVAQARDRRSSAQAAFAGNGAVALQHRYRAAARGLFSGAAALVAQATTKHITIGYPTSASFAAAASAFYFDPLLYVVISPISWGPTGPGGTVATITGYRTDGHPFQGNFTFAAPKWDDAPAHIVGTGAGLYVITQATGPGTVGILAVNPSSPGLPAGGSATDVTIVANDPIQPQGAAASGAATVRAKAIVGYAARFTASAIATVTVGTKQRYAGVIGFSGAATLVGSATTIVKPPPGAQLGYAIVSGAGAIVARAQYQASPAPIFSGSGSLQATIKFYRAAGLAALTGVATVSAAVTGRFRPTARLSAPGNLLAAPQGISRLSANISGTAALFGNALPAHHIRPGLSAVATLRAAVLLSARPRIGLVGAASLALRYTAVTYPQANFAAAASFVSFIGRRGLVYTGAASLAAIAALSARVNVELTPHHAIVSAAATIRTTPRVRVMARVRFAGGGTLSTKVNVISTSKARFAGGAAVNEIIRHVYTYYPLLDTGLPQRSPPNVYAYGYRGIAITADPLETSYLVVWLAFDRAVTNIQCVWDPLGANQAMTQETSDLPFGLATSATFWLFLPEPGVQTLEISWNGSPAQVQVNAATYGRTLYGRKTTPQQTDFVNFNIGQLMNKHR